MIIATSAKEADATYYTAMLDITGVIDAMTTSEEVTKSKPAGAHDAIAIGDNPYDVLGARKNEVRTIALLWGGFSELVLEEAGAVAIYRSIKDLYEHYDDSPLSRD